MQPLRSDIGKKNDLMPANRYALEKALLPNYVLFFRINEIRLKSNTTKNSKTVPFIFTRYFSN